MLERLKSLLSKRLLHFQLRRGAKATFGRLALPDEMVSERISRYRKPVLREMYRAIAELQRMEYRNKRRGRDEGNDSADADD
jgi:hypothetical protein